MYRQSEKKTCQVAISPPHVLIIIMVNFGTLAAEIVSLVWGTPANFNGFRVLAALLHGTLVVGVSQTATEVCIGPPHLTNVSTLPSEMQNSLT